MSEIYIKEPLSNTRPDDSKEQVCVCPEPVENPFSDPDYFVSWDSSRCVPTPRSGWQNHLYCFPSQVTKDDDDNDDDDDDDDDDDSFTKQQNAIYAKEIEERMAAQRILSEQCNKEYLEDVRKLEAYNEYLQKLEAYNEYLKTMSEKKENC